MKLSARNQLPGKVKEIKLGQVAAQIKVDVGGQTITALITREAAEELGLKKGDSVKAIIKATEVIISRD
jgi:molybdopterin-binding protein